MNNKRVEEAARLIGCVLNFECGGVWERLTEYQKEHYRRVAKAALELSDAAAWRPIDTAPRDGTLILVAVKHIECDVVSFWGAGWRETTNGLMLRDKPTHWQPLPAPPSDATP